MWSNRIAGSASNMRELCRAWSDYRDNWDRHDAIVSAVRTAAPTLATESPRQALASPKRGSKWFVASLRRPLPNRSIRSVWNRPEEGDQGVIPAWKDIGCEQYKAIEAVSANHQAERPVQVEKPRTALFPEIAFEFPQQAKAVAQHEAMVQPRRCVDKRLADRQRRGLLRCMVFATDLSVTGSGVLTELV